MELDEYVDAFDKAVERKDFKKASALLCKYASKRGDDENEEWKEEWREITAAFALERVYLLTRNGTNVR